MRSKTKKPATSPVVGGFSAIQAWFFGFEKVWLIPAVFLFFFTLLLYWPSYQAGMIWDDDLIVENPLIRGGWSGLRDIWFSTKFPDFIPLTATSFWLEWQLGVGSQKMLHATNIFLQGLNVVLVWRVLRRLKISGAWMAAAIFAAHPLCVTSVTWLAERKNTLSMLFYLLSFLFYLRSTEAWSRSSAAGKNGTGASENTSAPSSGTTTPQDWHGRFIYWLSFLFFIMGLLCKSSVVVLPVALLLCVWWQNGRIIRPDVRRLLPFFGVALAAGLATMMAHYYLGPKLGLGGMLPVPDSLLVRILAGTRAVFFYLGKSVLPVNLTMHYPRWEINPASLVSYLPGLVIMGALIIFWFFRRSWGRSCIFGLGYFILAVAPTLGVFKMTFLTFSQVADHFQFLALPGLIALLVGGAGDLAKRAPYQIQYLTSGLFLVIILTLAGLSWKHQQLIGNPEALWQDNIEKNPKSWVAHCNITKPLQNRGQLHEAEAHYRKALELMPNYTDSQMALAMNPTIATIQSYLGAALLSEKQFKEAVGPLSKAVEIVPANAGYHNNLAAALMNLGELDEALLHFREATRLNPTNVAAHINLGLLLSQQKKFNEALDLFRRAFQLDPANLTNHTNLGLLLAYLDQNSEALGYFAEVVKLQPENIQAQTGMGYVLTKQGKLQEAATHSAIAKFLRGRELANNNDLREAHESFRKALDLDASVTIEFAGQVCTLATPNSLTHLDILVAACVEAGRFSDTINALHKAATLAENARQTDAALKYHNLLEQYRQRPAPP